MKTLFAGFFCLWLLYTQFLSAQDSSKVTSLTVLEAGKEDPLEIPEDFETRPSTVFHPAALEDDLARLIRQCGDEGFVRARIASVVKNASSQGSGLDILITVEKGKPATMHSLVIEGAKTATEDELKSHFQLVMGGLFTQRTLETDIQGVLKYYEQKGYPFTKLAVKYVTFSESADSLLTSVVLSVEEGQRVVISELRVEGNKSTKENVIIREARLQPDQIFDDRLQERIKRNLEKLNLFSSVSLPELYLTEDARGGLLIRVMEGNPNLFDGILGYVPSQRIGDEGFFTGLINVQFCNLLGTGRRFSTRWYRENQLTQEIEMHYYEPWIGSYPLNGLGDFLQRKQDSTYVRRSYGLNLELMLNETVAFGISYSQASVIPSEGYGKSILAESRLTSLGAYLRYDSRDNPAIPTSGVLYRTEYHSGVKNILSAPANTPITESSTRRISMDLSYYVKVFSRQVLASELHLRDFRSDHVELADLFRLGGATTLRGYKEGQFLGSTLVWLNLEYQLLAGGRSLFYAFGDVGYIVVPENASSGLQGSEQTKAGYGLGVRIDSGLGLIGVNLGFGKGDTFSTAKLHVRLMNEF